MSTIFPLFLTVLIVFGIALIPGWANAFLVFGLLIDRRPVYRYHEFLPAVSVLVAAYNEEETIYTTIESVVRQEYPGLIAAVVFRNYAIVGLITLFLLPLMVLVNVIMYLHQRSIFRHH